MYIVYTFIYIISRYIPTIGKPLIDVLLLASETKETLTSNLDKNEVIGLKKRPDTRSTSVRVLDPN